MEDKFYSHLNFLDLTKFLQLLCITLITTTIIKKNMGCKVRVGVQQVTPTYSGSGHSSLQYALPMQLHANVPEKVLEDGSHT